MISLKYLLDSMCANFTESCMHDLVKIMVDETPCTVSDIALKIVARDRSLDSKSAETLAEAAVQALAQTGDIVIRGSYIYPID